MFPIEGQEGLDTPLEGGGENMICGVFGQAPKGEKWGLGVSRFRLIERKRK